MSILWHDRRRYFGLPISMTVYELTEQSLTLRTGFFDTKEDVISLYRISDISLSQKFVQKLFGVGTLHIYANDKTHSHLDLIDIKFPKEVKTLLSLHVEIQRNKSRMRSAEIYNQHIENDMCEDDINT